MGKKEDPSESETRLATPEDRAAVDLPPFEAFRASAPAPVEESTVKVAVAELKILRADSAWAQRTRRFFGRFKALPPALRRIADMIDEMISGG